MRKASFAIFSVLVSFVASSAMSACGSDNFSSSPNADSGISDGATSSDASVGEGGSSDASPDGAAPRPPSGAFLVNETFNAMTTAAAPIAPWTTTVSPAGAALVQEIPFPADKSVELTKPDATGDTSLNVAFGSQSGRVVFEAKVKAAETAGFKAIPYIYDSAGDAVASVEFQDGNIQTHVGGVTTTVQSFNANEWYRVRVVVDTAKGVFDLYVDGVRKEQAVALRTPEATVDHVSWFMDGTNTGTLWVDNVKVFTEAGYIGAAPSPQFDVRKYGATGNGTTADTAAIQSAINDAANTGGSVILSGGTFLSGELTLKSNMTFFIDSSAVLLGSANASDYPTETPATGNTQLLNCQRALLYAPNTNNLWIDGGGTIDGQGDSFSGVEGTRPLLIWSVLSQNLTVQNLYLRKGAVWSLVSMESDHVLINDINLQSNDITHDGIDICDGTDITVQNCAINSGDDAMCIKSGVRRGIDSLTVKDSVFSGNQGGSNGIKVGTATYGAIKNVTVQDSWVKDVQYAAMAVESRQGSDIGPAFAFNRIEFTGTGGAFFVYLAQENDIAPTGDVPKLGSVNGVSFTDIHGVTATWPNTPHQGSLITGVIYNATTYPIQNLSFTRATVSFDGNLSTVPAAPPEAVADQYPEANMFGDLPAWGYYLRHVQNVTFDSCSTSVQATDARQELVTDDVSGQVGSP
jgi:hypothetical protein